MKFKIFISWSNESKESLILAEFLKNWLELIFTTQIEIFVSTDIPKGTIGSCEIIEELKNSNLGIICLSEKNLNNPWIHFETGALFKKNPCIILIGLDPSKLEPPLNLYQHITLERDEIWKMIKIINKKISEIDKESSIKIDKLENLFEKLYPDFGEKIIQINHSFLTTLPEQKSIKKKEHIPVVNYKIFQRENTQLPEVRFSIWYAENNFPIDVQVVIDIFLNEELLKFEAPPNGLYNGKEWWTFNPMTGVNGWFKVPMEVIEGVKIGHLLELKINVRLKDSNNIIYDYNPVGYVYQPESNSWYYAPDRILHVTNKPYIFIGWDNL